MSDLRELDAEIERCVFGHAQIEQSDLSSLIENLEEPCITWGYVADGCWYPFAAYSRDLNAAWAAWEKVHETHPEWELIVSTQAGLVRVAVTRGLHWVDGVSATTPAEAICRAVLVAVRGAGKEGR